MDWIALIDAMGGGLSAVIIVGLAFWGWSERKERVSSQNSRMDEMRLYTQERISDSARYLEQSVENTRTLERALAVLEARKNA